MSGNDALTLTIPTGAGAPLVVTASKADIPWDMIISLVISMFNAWLNRPKLEATSPATGPSVSTSPPSTTPTAKPR